MQATKLTPARHPINEQTDKSMRYAAKVVVVQSLVFAGFVVFGLVVCSLWNDEQERRFKEDERAQQAGRERAAARRARAMAQTAYYAPNNFYATNNFTGPLTRQERELAQAARALLLGTNTTNRGKALWGTNVTNVSTP